MSKHSDFTESRLDKIASQELPDHSELIKQEWMPLKKATEIVVDALIAGRVIHSSERTNELKLLRKRAKYSGGAKKEKNRIEVKTIKNIDYIRPKQFFPWATARKSSWEILAELLGVQFIDDYTDNFSFNDELAERVIPSDSDTLKEAYRAVWDEREQLEREKADLRKQNSELQRDASAYRKEKEERRERGRKYRPKAHSSCK